MNKKIIPLTFIIAAAGLWIARDARRNSDAQFIKTASSVPETTSEQSFEDISAQAAPVDARAALEKYRSDVPSKPRLSDEEVSRKKAEVKERQVARREAQEAPLEPGRHWRVSSGGPPIVYELAFDELWVQPVGEDGAIKSIQSTENLAELENAAQNEVGGRAQLVMYPRGEERTLYNRRIVGSQLLLSGGDEEARSTALQSLKLEADPNAKVGGPFLVVRSENRPAGVLLAMQEATDVTLPEGVTISPMLARQVQKKWIPTDPLFSGQWHLRNTGQKSGKVGEDAKTTTTWDTYRGTGVKIAIVDDGLDLTHPDLAANVAATGHYDWNGGDTNPQPNPAKEDYHGTAVGGVAAAVGGNGIGGVGTAPSATLVGYRFISGPTYDYDEYDAMTRDSGTIPIKNNSWGNPDGYGLGYVSSLFKLGVQNATETGRGGLGTIFVFAGGNGKEYDDNSNKDGYANDIHVLAVGATTNKGYGASYSEDGANLVVSAPSSGGSLDVTTTDLQGFSGYNDGATVGELSNSDYTNEFGGTSSAAPVISGVVAMMLEANPNLGWRDVKEILLRSSRKLYPTSRDWVSRSGGRVGIAPIKHQHAFGGGAVDANAATKMAMTWTNLDPATSISQSVAPYVYIPDNSSYGVSVPIDFSGQSDLRVEHVEVTVNISHSFGGDLEAFLVSPSGAVSVLATPAFSGYENYQNWTFSSVRHWGEKSSGTWTFIVADRDALVSGTLNTVTVRIHGVPIEAPTLTTEPVNQFLVEGSSSSLVAEATGIRDIEYLWRRGTTQVKRSTSNEYAMAPVKLTHAGVYSVTALNMGGSDRSENFSVGVVRVQNVPVVVNVGRDLILDAIASAGVPLTYQWYKDGAPLVDDLRVKGSQTKRLIVRATVPDDSAVYHCIVSDGSASLSAGDRTVSIREKPIMDPAVLDGTIVAGNPYHLFTAVNEVTSFVATGVPSGMTFNRRTGELAGKPRVPGSYTIKVYAVNPAGRSEVAVYTLEVAALPQEIQGVFQGLIEREDGLTKSHGGRIQLTVSRTGSYSGFVYLGAERRSIRGYLDATPDGSPPTLDFRIYRGRTLPPYFVHLSFDASMEKATGEVNDGDTLTAAIEATRYAWHSRLNPATSLAGKYTAQASLPLASIGDAGVPQGVTALTLTASTAGTVRYSGRMGDLTAVSGSCYLDKNGKFSPFNRLYGNRGSVLGWLQIVADPGSEFADNSVSGSLDWNRLLQPATSRQYPLGFVPQILTASGSKFVPPPTGQIVLNLPDPATVPDGKNAGITFFGGNVESASLAGDLMDVPFSVALTHRTTFGVDNRIGNPALIRLTISRTTGALTGTFTLVDPNPLYPTKTIKRVVTYRGLLVGDQGVGAFGLLQLPDPGAVPAQRWPYTPLLHGGFLMQALNSGE